MLRRVSDPFDRKPLPRVWARTRQVSLRSPARLASLPRPLFGSRMKPVCCLRIRVSCRSDLFQMDTPDVVVHVRFPLDQRCSAGRAWFATKMVATNFGGYFFGGFEPALPGFIMHMVCWAQRLRGLCRSSHRGDPAKNPTRITSPQLPRSCAWKKWAHLASCPSSLSAVRTEAIRSLLLATRRRASSTTHLSPLRSTSPVRSRCLRLSISRTLLG